MQRVMVNDTGYAAHRDRHRCADGKKYRRKAAIAHNRRPLLWVSRYCTRAWKTLSEMRTS